MMKNCIIFPLILSSLVGFSQLTLKRADKYFNKLDYKKAAELYEAYLFDKDDAYSQLQLAKIYSHMNYPVQTAKWYEELIDREDLEPVHYLNYAQALCALGKYQEALPYYQKYQTLAKDPLLAQEKTYGINHINDFFADSSLMEVSGLDVSSVESDYAPTLLADKLVFASGRGNWFGLQRKFAWNNKNYYDLYTVANNGKIVNFNKKLNSKYHEGKSAFSADGKTIYFTRNNYSHGKFGRSVEGINKLKILIATLDEHGQWYNIREFKYNSNEYSTGDPFLSKDGQTMYFVSDMPGGFGGTDVYKSTLVNNEWSQPSNLGHKVNTESNERTPFLSPEGVLYFASEGHFGLGGLDVYQATMTGETVSGIRNMGAPLNSTRDDFGFIFEPTSRIGFFSSDRPGGKGDDDIYQVKIKEDPKVNFSGTTYWRSDREDIYQRKILPFATLKIKNLSSGQSTEIESDENGSFSTALTQGANYQIWASKDTLLKSLAMIDLSNKANKVLESQEMILVQQTPKAKNVTVEGSVIDAITKKAVANPQLYLYNTQTEQTTLVPVDANGKYVLDLNQNTYYLLKTVANGYLVNCISFNTPAASDKAMKLSEPLEMSKLALNTKLEVENLYYDLGKFDIKPASALELDKVVQFMTDNSGISVELGAHTDARGSSVSNASLSDNRAKAAHDYIVSKGIEDSHISYKGYGEAQPLNKCKDGVKCTEDQYAINRRTEIKITGIKSDLDPTATINLYNAFVAGQAANSCKQVGLAPK
jgi:outer membrane protein OmpA-like peptidoglycan-associated protein